MTGVSESTAISPTIDSFLTFNISVRLIYLKYILRISSLLELDYSIIPSEIVTSSIDYLKKTSLIWKYSRRLLLDKNENLLYYLYY
jgi:hypothetical protein